jgi:urease accessory protein
MTAPAADLVRLMAWLSPAFPIGGFSYSHGLERAVHDGVVTGRDSLEDWLEVLIGIGSGWNDAVLLSAAWQRVAENAGVDDIAELAEALAGSEERHRETMLQGTAFAAAASAWPAPASGCVPETCPYPVAVGALAAAHGVPLASVLSAFLQAFAGALLQASIRLGVIGQTAATGIIAGLEPLLLSTAERASRATLADLGSAAFLSDIMAMRHETQHSRLFRS